MRVGGERRLVVIRSFTFDGVAPGEVTSSVCVEASTMVDILCVEADDGSFIVASSSSDVSDLIRNPVKVASAANIAFTSKRLSNRLKVGVILSEW